MTTASDGRVAGPALDEFRLGARSWLAANLPARRPEEAILDWDDADLVARDRAIQRLLHDGGYAGLTVPEAYGGRGLDPRFEQAFLEEARPYRLPWAFGVAFNVVIPTLLAHADEAMKRRFVPAILRGDHIWCQFLSEPSGGSDLAGLLTRAVRDGDTWVLNGSKVWTTGANLSDMAICLARTDPEVPKHAGLTMFAVPMDTPGVTVVPLRLLDGGGDFCQEFLDDVAIPADHVIGDVNDGWRVASTLMTNERSAVGRGWHIGLGRAASEARTLTLSPDVVDLARDRGLLTDSHARQLVAEAWVLDAVQALTVRRVAAAMRAGLVPSHAAALPKLMSGKVGARRTALLSELAGPYGVASPPGRGSTRWGMARVSSHNIGGGTGEMQSNAVAERLLGLPREPSDDRELPFNRLRQNTTPVDFTRRDG